MKVVRDKTEQIMKAALSAFIEKGLQATTMDIAKEADVAEVTLYRKFSTKKNLFITVIKNVLEKKFASTVMEYAKEEDTEKFLAAIINNRLDVLSKHKDLIKMLISESLRGNLTDDINFPVIIFTSLQAGLDAHFEMMGRQVDTEHLARAISGMLLSYILFPHETAFHELSEAEKNRLAQKHAQSIVAMI